ncbi:FERM domain-containing protein 3 [Fasciola hepatica]|uniref:FERM domain-containing protein 3 n=1 Tax=Fasciola hepatica TaxID=6192 RepID=A0A4E0R0A3_FASHE|nr:FERM domain-containing protein 3 [Fasciola hepatica]
MGSRHRVHKHARSEDCFTVSVRLLEEDTSEDVEVPEDATGKWMFEEICRKQGVMEEREYFGLRYLEHEMLSSPTKQWLDLARSVRSQLKNTRPRVVSFRIKHYPAEPMADLRLPKTHYLLYRQLKRDLCSGRLVAQLDEMVRLGALVVQVELGDSSVQEVFQWSANDDTVRSYLADFQVLHNQTPKVESLLLEEHKKLE